MKMKKIFINLFLAVLFTFTFLFSNVSVYAMEYNALEKKENRIIDYSNCEFTSFSNRDGDVIISAIDEKNDFKDYVILEKETGYIIYHNDIVGTYSSNASNLKGISLKASSTWRYLGVNNYKITATGAGVTAAAIAIIAGYVGGPAAGSILGGLSAFVGTATTGGTLTVQTWERYIGTQYYQKHKIKFTTSTGEVWGPVETIKAY